MIAQREAVKCSPIKVWAKTNEGADEECVIECEIGCNNGVCKAVEASKWVKMGAEMGKIEEEVRHKVHTKHIF